MATHSSVLAWEIPWTEEPGELNKVLEVTGVGHDLVTKPPPPSIYIYVSICLYIYSYMCIYVRFFKYVHL